MGATLPILVRALRVRDDASISDDEGGFGIALGRLYACNTIGAVVGAVAGEVAIIEWVGVLGTAWVAALLDIIAAGGALGIARYFSGTYEVSPPKLDGGPTFWARCLLGAAFLSGAVLLALEVVWFRFPTPFCAGDYACFCRDAICGAYGYWCGRWVGRPMAAPQCRGFSHTSRPRARFRDAHGCYLLGFCLCGDAFWNGVYWQYIANFDAISGSDVSRVSFFRAFCSLSPVLRSTATCAARHPSCWPAHTRQYHRCWSGCSDCGFWAVATYWVWKSPRLFWRSATALSRFSFQVCAGNTGFIMSSLPRTF